MIAAIAHFQQGNFDFRGISFRRVNSPFVSPGSSHLSFLSDGSTSRILGNKEKQKLPNKLWPNQRILRFGFVIPRSSGPSGSSDTANESSSQAKAPFGYTRKDVLLIGLGVTVFGVALKSGLEFAGVDPLQAGNVVQLLVVLGMTIGWISTYMFRVANKDMTYAQQLRDYENKVMEKRLEGLTEAELQVLLEQVEEEKRHGSSRGKLGKAGIGGILRDHRGDYHCLFAKPVGIKDSNEAEFIAIVHALELSKEKSWIKEKNLIVESDSKAAAAWASSENLCPWGLRFEWNRLKCLEKLFRRVTFTYQRREPNDS